MKSNFAGHLEEFLVLFNSEKEYETNLAKLYSLAKLEMQDLEPLNHKTVDQKAKEIRIELYPEYKQFFNVEYDDIEYEVWNLKVALNYFFLDVLACISSWDTDPEMQRRAESLLNFITKDWAPPTSPFCDEDPYIDFNSPPFKD